MGQITHPYGFRVGITEPHKSRWYAPKALYGELLVEDYRIREFVDKRLNRTPPFAAVSDIHIERTREELKVIVSTARPGLVIGKKGGDIEVLRKELASMTTDEVRVNLVEIRKPEIDATLIADDIARQLERRASFRRAMKRSIQSTMRLGAKGIRINVSGRLGGAEIARMEWYREGRVPLHTLRADIDYGVATAQTTYGAIGIKVWIFKGEIMEHDPMGQEKRLIEAQTGGVSGQQRASNRA